MKKINKWMTQSVNKASNAWDSSIIENVKKFLLFIFVVLIVADVAFVFTDELPTISQVVLDSSPKYLIFIFLFGLATANIFFKRPLGSRLVSETKAVIILTLSILGLVLWGLNINDDNINCDNFNQIKASPIYQIVCKECMEDRQQYLNSNCNKVTKAMCSDPSRTFDFKLDLTTEIKLILLFGGFIFGFLFWPQFQYPDEHLRTSF
ncbi:MAG: hypothetical protein HKO66_08890 [Saprospiraceae bacterium]|nr:hypothetical protein [Bacteroidia bacterium]NNE16753.1 hypothetical protein [Saprospiraceae bacterium]NNL92332.1 hypothetical protein [Saprospiraceae bacterium]